MYNDILNFIITSVTGAQHTQVKDRELVTLQKAAWCIAHFTQQTVAACATMQGRLWVLITSCESGPTERRLSPSEFIPVMNTVVGQGSRGTMRWKSTPSYLFKFDLWMRKIIRSKCFTCCHKSLNWRGAKSCTSCKIKGTKTVILPATGFF